MELLLLLLLLCPEAAICCVHTAAAALNGLRGVFPGVKDSGQTPRSPGCSHAVSTSTARRWHFDRREFSRGLEFSQRPSRQHPHWAFSGPQKRTGDSGGKAAREERERSRFPPRHLNSTGPLCRRPPRECGWGSVPQGSQRREIAFVTSKVSFSVIWLLSGGAQ